VRVVKISIIFSFIFLLGIFGIQESFAEDNRNMVHLEKKGVIITFSTDKSSYSPQEPIHVAYQIKNQGEDGINYYKGDSCDDGFFGYFANQDEEYYFNRFLGAGVYLIPENNPLGKRIDDTFYGELLFMIENNENRDYGIIVYGDKKRIAKVLQEDHNASSINEATRLSFVTAKVPVNEILKIAKYSFVHSIGDGEKKLCALGVMRGTLDNGDEYEKSFYLSQEFYKYPGVHTLPLGNYDVVLNFRLLDEKVLPAGSSYGGSPKAGTTELLTLKLPITISDEPPNEDTHVKLISKEKSTTVSLRQQIANGISPQNIVCNPEFYLVFKATDKSPACAKFETAIKLYKRGWAKSMENDAWQKWAENVAQNFVISNLDSRYEIIEDSLKVGNKGQKDSLPPLISVGIAFSALDENGESVNLSFDVLIIQGDKVEKVQAKLWDENWENWEVIPNPFIEK